VPYSSVPVKKNKKLRRGNWNYNRTTKHEDHEAPNFVLFVLFVAFVV
jgi:hypothetical protein